ncbi:MAG: hypothetical protein ABIO70_30505 [Pseudomonadota bacterium]
MPSLRLLVFTAALALLPAAAGGEPPAASLSPVDQPTLDTWWHATNTLWTAETSYKVQGKHFEDGVCAWDFDDGVFIPVYNGEAPVAERQVGVVFIGQGTVSMSFPEPGDAAAFANHMVRQAGADPRDFAAIAAGEAPFETAITRGMIISADPAVQRLLYDLEPIGAGVIYHENTAEGVDAEYVVTEGRQRLRDRAVATNLLPTRRNALVEEGLDPVAMLRQDRLMGGELGVPGEDLRLVADFQTDTPFRVAAESGRTASGGDYDRWLTCYRDGMGQSSLGYRTSAFTFGKDNDGDHHFQRFSGQAWTTATDIDDPRPPLRLEPVSAEIEVSAKPANFFSNEQHAEVDSTLTLRAVGGPVRHVVLRLPTAHIVVGSFKIQDLSVVDGATLARVSLTADLAHRDQKGRERGADEVGGAPDEDATASPDGVDGDGSGTDLSGTVAAAADAAQTDVASVDEGFSDGSRELFSQTSQRTEIIALLPEAVPEGEEVRVHFAWEANWPYANWSWDGAPLGSTTGFQPVLPEVLPELYENAWDYRLTMSVPGTTLRTLSVAASGDTIEKWDDIEGTGRRWVTTDGKHAHEPGVAIGQWKEREEPAAADLPGVSAHLFFKHASALPSFPPEVRRVVSFLERFLPGFPQREVEVWQGASVFSGTAERKGFYATAYGLVGMTTVAQHSSAGADLEVGQASAVEHENPYLAQTMVARQVAHQYFGETMAPATERDRWLDEALSDAYALFYLRAAIGKDAFDERLDAVREGLEDPTERAATLGQTNRYHRPYSLTGATYASDISHKLRAEYGLYVVAQMLRHKIGDQPYFMAIDRMVGARQGGSLSTERFQQLMEAASGQDLSDFFAFWIHGGLIPTVTLQTRVDPQDNGRLTVHGCLVSDVPFGTFEVPVQLFEPSTGKIAGGPVKVEDGLGRFDVAGWKTEPELELDPELRILAYGRKLDRIKGPSRCEEAGR